MRDTTYLKRSDKRHDFAHENDDVIVVAVEVSEDLGWKRGREGAK